MTKQNDNKPITTDENRIKTITTDDKSKEVIKPERLVFYNYTPAMYRDMLTRDIKERFGADVFQIETNIAKDNGEEDEASNESRLKIACNMVQK